jgi:hypothetical protein
MCVVKSDKNRLENSPAKPPARATRPLRLPQEPETAGAAGAAAAAVAAAGATFPRPETSVRAIQRQGRPAGEGERAAARAEAAGPAGEFAHPYPLGDNCSIYHLSTAYQTNGHCTEYTLLS